MRPKRELILLAILTLALFMAAALAFGPAQNKASKAVEEDRAKYPVPADAIELEFKFSFPEENPNDARSILWRPHGIAGSPSGDIYVTDEYQNKIFVFNLKGQLLSTFGRKGQGPGDLNFPQKLAFWYPRSLLIYDIGNMRFQTLSASGEYEASFKIFKGYRSFCLDDHGNIYATNARVADVYSEKEKLVDVYSKEGKLLKSFGEGLPSKTSGIYNFAHITRNQKDEILVAFVCYPIIRKYSIDGQLLGEYRINDPLMKEKEIINRKNAINPATPLEARSTYPVIKSFISFQKRVYLMRSYPRTEIMELDSDSLIIKRTYWTEQPEADLSANEFMVQEVENRIYFYVVNIRESRIDVFTPISH